MYLRDVLPSLTRGMQVRVWVETIWPGSKAVAIVYDGMFAAISKERIQSALLHVACRWSVHNFFLSMFGLGDRLY